MRTQKRSSHPTVVYGERSDMNKNIQQVYPSCFMEHFSVSVLLLSAQKDKEIHLCIVMGSSCCSFEKANHDSKKGTPKKSGTPAARETRERSEASTDAFSSTAVSDITEMERCNPLNMRCFTGASSVRVLRDDSGTTAEYASLPHFRCPRHLVEPWQQMRDREDASGSWSKTHSASKMFSVLPCNAEFTAQ